MDKKIAASTFRHRRGERLIKQLSNHPLHPPIWKVISRLGNSLVFTTSQQEDPLHHWFYVQVCATECSTMFPGGHPFSYWALLDASSLRCSGGNRDLQYDFSFPFLPYILIFSSTIFFSFYESFFEFPQLKCQSILLKEKLFISWGLDV